MFLRVVGKPASAVVNGPQKLTASFNPSTGVHTVCCNVDVVTLGVTLSVLKREFDACLAGLEPSLAERIRKTTEEAVHNEQDRS